VGQPVEVRVFSTAPKKPGACAGFFVFKDLVTSTGTPIGRFAGSP
jgi:hypothetical protein